MRPSSRLAFLTLLFAATQIVAVHVIREKEEAHFVVREALKKKGKHGKTVDDMRAHYREKKR